MCPTLQRLLEVERDAFFGAKFTNNKPLIRAWDRYNEAISKLLHREDLEDYLLEEEDL